MVGMCAGHMPRPLKIGRARRIYTVGILTSTGVIFPKLALLSASVRAKDTRQSVVVSLMALLKLPDETSIVQSPSVVTVLKGLHVV